MPRWGIPAAVVGAAIGFGACLQANTEDPAGVPLLRTEEGALFDKTWALPDLQPVI